MKTVSRTTTTGVLFVAALTTLLFTLNEPVGATEPTTPIEIITPEDSARSGKFTTDMVEVIMSEKEIIGYKALMILFQNGKRINGLAVALDTKPLANTEDGSKQGLSVAKIAAVPKKFWKEVKPGIYAHKIRIEANLKGGSGSLLLDEWVRWRTDGERVELLTIERYSALVEKTETAIGADGNQILILRGGGIKLADPGKPTMEKIDTRIGDDGVRLERSGALKKEEMNRSLDESKED